MKAGRNTGMQMFILQRYINVIQVGIILPGDTAKTQPVPRYHSSHPSVSQHLINSERKSENYKTQMPYKIIFDLYLNQIH